MGWFERMKLDCLESLLGGLERLASLRGGDRMPPHLAVGLSGEQAAFFHLRRKGYTVVAQRWSGGLPGDVDIIAWQGSILCFVEVKTRTAHDISAAEIAVDSHKRNTLRRLARRYVRQLPQQTAPPVRFDVLSVYLVPGQKKEFVHFEGAFTWSEWEDAHER